MLLACSTFRVNFCGKTRTPRDHMMRSSLLLALSGLPMLALAQDCPLQFDGRVPADFALADFDAANDIFDPDSVFGRGVSPTPLAPEHTADWTDLRPRPRLQRSHRAPSRRNARMPTPHSPPAMSSPI